MYIASQYATFNLELKWLMNYIYDKGNTIIGNEQNRKQGQKERKMKTSFWSACEGIYYSHWLRREKSMHTLCTRIESSTTSFHKTCSVLKPLDCTKIQYWFGSLQVTLIAKGYEVFTFQKYSNSCASYCFSWLNKHVCVS